MKAASLLLLFCLLAGWPASSQSAPYDSLELRLKAEKTDTGKLILVKQLVDLSFGADLGRALGYSRQGVALADQLENKDWQPKFYEMQGRMHANMLQLDSASHYFSKAMKGYLAVGNRRGQATTHFKIGWVFKKLGQMDSALTEDLAALKLMEELDDKMGIAGAYERISDDLNRQGRMKESLDYAQKAIAICQQNGLRDELVYANVAAGDVSIAMGKPEDALAFYDSSIAITLASGAGEMIMCDFTNKRGNALKGLGRYKEALDCYTFVLQTAEKIGYSNAISTAYANLGEVNLLMGNYKKALPYQLKTVELQEKDGDLSNIVENYRHVGTIYEKLGDYKTALKYQQRAFEMRDSITSLESDATMSKMLTQYETGKKEATIAMQQKQLSQHRLVQWLMAGVAVLLAGFLVFVYRSYVARTKSNTLLAAKNAENELLLKEIHHRVKNNLEVVSSLLALQSAQIDDAHTKEAMQEGQNRVQSIGIVHQKLYQGENLGAIEMKDYFFNLSESILDSFGVHGRVQVECAMEALHIDVDTAVPLGLIVNELLTNTLKYAFPDGRSGKVEIRLEKQKNGILQLQVSDNGVGKTGATHGTGFGSQLIQLLTRQLNGSMREEPGIGTHIFFEFRTGKAA